MSRGSAVAVSRLRFDGSLPGPRDVEIPHVRGEPVAGYPVGQAVSVRSWPNRAGVCEVVVPGERVDWYRGLAPAPPAHAIVRVVGSLPGVTDDDAAFAARLARFRTVLATVAQLPGVVPAARPDALCAILMTPGTDHAALAAADRAFPSAFSVIPEHLAEFPGGVQVLYGPSAWERPDAYAGTLEALVGGAI